MGKVCYVEVQDDMVWWCLTRQAAVTCSWPTTVAQVRILTHSSPARQEAESESGEEQGGQLSKERVICSKTFLI